MRRRLLLAAVCIFGFPLMFASPRNGELVNSVPYDAIAFAGHNTAGGWCATPCCYGCIPDEGEQCVLCSQSVNDSPIADAQPDSLPADSIPDFGPEVMLGLLMVLLVLRINRA